MANLSPLLTLARLTLLLVLVQQSTPSNVTTHATNRSAGELPLTSSSTKSDRRDQGFGRRFIEFNTDTKDKLKIDLKFSVPFLSIPLHHEDPTQPPKPFEVNLRGVMLAAGLGAIAYVVVPVLTGNSASILSTLLPPRIEVPAVPAPFPHPTWVEK